MRAAAVRLALRRWGSDATSPLGVRLAAWDADPDGPEVGAVWLDVEARTSPTYYSDALVLARAHLLAQMEGAGSGATAVGPVAGITHMRRTVRYATPTAASESDAELMGTAPGRAFLAVRKSRPNRHPGVVWPR
jgi:hypothetical protein